jgi:hypothetical protein
MGPYFVLVRRAAGVARQEVRFIAKEHFAVKHLFIFFFSGQ